MRLQVAVFYNGFALALTGLFMLVSAGVGVVYHDGSAGLLTVSGLLIAGIGYFPMIFIPRRTDVRLRESIFVVAFGWLTCTFAGAIPFYLYGPPFSFVNSIFESISGFTTTGASILATVEDLPKGLLFWRACTEWLGGIGIVSFALAVMPRMGQVSRPLFQQEYTGLVVPPANVRATDILRGLFAVYLGLTLTQTVLLAVTGMPLYDAATTALATLPTGGFSVRNASLAYYNSVAVDVITMVFMFLGGMNFVYLHVLLTQPRKARQGLEVAALYYGLILAVVALVVFLIRGSVYTNWGDALRFGSFQVISVATTTGFGTADSSVWPIPAQIAIVMILLIGACNGSTGGGIKHDRILLFFKLLHYRFRQMVHPSALASIRVDGRYVDLDAVERTVFYIAPYLATLGLATLILSCIGMNAVDSFTGTAACLANAGPGMGSLGTMENYSAIPTAAKVILSFVMLFGRLEMFALVLPFTPGFWRK